MFVGGVEKKKIVFLYSLILLFSYSAFLQFFFNHFLKFPIRERKWIDLVWVFKTLGLVLF